MEAEGVFVGLLAADASRGAGTGRPPLGVDRITATIAEPEAARASKLVSTGERGAEGEAPAEILVLLGAVGVIGHARISVSSARLSPARNSRTRSVLPANRYDSPWSRRSSGLSARRVQP